MNTYTKFKNFASSIVSAKDVVVETTKATPKKLMAAPTALRRNLAAASRGFVDGLKGRHSDWSDVDFSCTEWTVEDEAAVQKLSEVDAVLRSCGVPLNERLDAVHVAAEALARTR